MEYHRQERLGRSDINANMTYGTERANAYKILEDTLNLRDVRIYDTVEDADGREKRVLNSKETTLAQQKQQAIKDAFRNGYGKTRRGGNELVQSITSFQRHPSARIQRTAYYILRYESGDTTSSIS